MASDERARTPDDVSVPEMERLLGLALRRGGGFADLYFQHHRTSSLLLEEGILRTASAGVSCGLGVRVVSGEKTGYAYTDDLSWEAMKRAAETAAYIAEGTRELPPERVAPAPVERRYGAGTVSDLDVVERVALVERADRAARAYDPRIEKVIVSLADETKKLRIANSMGVLVEDVQPLFSIRVSAIAVENGVRREGSSGGGGRVGPEFFAEKPPEYFAREAARMAVTMLAARPAPAGPMPVVLAPGWPGILLHEAVGHGLEGDFNRKGTSAFAGRMGQRVASPGVTVVDDGSIRDRRGSLNVDDEGQRPGRTILIEDGILRGYLQDRLNSGLMRMAPTGNGRRQSYAHIPMPRMTNTFMLAGRDDPADILRSVKRGLYAKHFGGGQVDITSGKFVFSASEAYLIEDGRLGPPVVGATLIGDGPDILTKVQRIGHDLQLDEGVGTCGKAGQSVPVGVGLPTLLVSEITVGGTAR
ncbi:MAG TPA: metalloprotease TldD [Vicinamibacteria bacterium]|nr:metalloprotease TldD [Vicinamibacteria bacterium]